MILSDIQILIDKDLAKFLECYLKVFEQVQHYELQLSEGAVETPAAIESAMKELVALYSSLNTATGLIEAKTTVQEAKAYIQYKDQSNGLKTTESYIRSQVDLECAQYHRICKIFGTCRDNCDRMISVLQSSLKHAEREQKLNV